MLWTPSGNIVNDGLVLYLDTGVKGSYPNSGTTWTDLAGIADATLVNSPTYNKENGGVIQFNGSSSFAEIFTNNENLRFGANDPYSISAWVRPGTHSAGVFPSLFAYSPNPALLAGGYYFQLDNGGLRSKSLLFDYTDNTGKFWSIQAPASSWVENTWYNFVGVYSGSGGASGANIYKNSTLLTKTIRGNTSPSSANYVSNSAKCQVGIRFNTGYLNGSIGQVMIYNRALSAAEINQNFQVTRKRFGI